MWLTLFGLALIATQSFSQDGKFAVKIKKFEHKVLTFSASLPPYGSSFAALRLVATYRLRTRLPQCGTFSAFENAMQCDFSS